MSESTHAGAERPGAASDGATDRRIRSGADLDRLTLDTDGLVPVVAQDVGTGSVLMVAWADRTALEATLETGFVHYWSRSRGELWKKGETSGNTLSLVSLHADCDEDTVLALVEPAGPACHTGEPTCFGAGATPIAGAGATPTAGATGGPAPPPDGAILAELASVIRDRNRERPEGSYTTRLLSDENLRLKKLGEEVTELVAALVRRDAAAPEEAADLLYHVMVALEAADLEWAEVERALARRRG